MVWIYLIAVLICATVDASIKKTASEKIAGFLENRCLKNADAETYEELMDENATKDCILNHLRRVENKGIFIETFCTEFRYGIYKCYEQLMYKMEPCLEPEEKYLPLFLLAAHNVSYDRGCADEGKIVEDIMAKIRTSNCVIPLLSLPSLLLPDCSSNIKIIRNLGNPKFILTKPDLCSDLEIAKECFLEGANEYCEDSSVNVEIISFVFDNYLDTCQA